MSDGELVLLGGLIVGAVWWAISSGQINAQDETLFLQQVETETRLIQEIALAAASPSEKGAHDRS